MPTTVRLTSEDEEKLNALVKATGRTKTFYIKQLFSLYLDRIIEMYSLDQAKKDVASGKQQIFEIDDVEKILLSGDSFSEAGS